MKSTDIVLTDPDELIAVPPEVTVCHMFRTEDDDEWCGKPLKVALIDGWTDTGIQDRWIYDATNPEIMFFLYCGCQDWKVDDRRPVRLPEEVEWRPGRLDIRCDCDLTDEIDSVAEWLGTRSSASVC